MGDLLGAVAEDIEEYRRLCEKYGEQPVDGIGELHGRALQEREKREIEELLRQLTKHHGELAGIASAHGGSRNRGPNISIFPKDEAQRARLKKILPATQNGIAMLIW